MSRGVLRSADDAEGGGATLVLCPTSLLAQWADELHTRGGFREGGGGGGGQLIVYYGLSRGELPPQMTSRQLVLSTYGVAASEYAAASSGGSGSGGGGGRRRGGRGLYGVAWRRVSCSTRVT